MVNKKIILSILAVGMLATVAGAGTWAYMQDQITSTDNGVEVADFGFTVDGVATTNGVASFEGIPVPNVIIPGATGTIATYNIANTGDVAGDVYAKIVPADGFNENIAIIVSGFTMTSTPQNIGTLGVGENSDSEITYEYANLDSNQFAEEGLTSSFDFVYYFVPTGETPVE